MVGRTIFLLAFPRSFKGGGALAGGGRHGPVFVVFVCFSSVAVVQILRGLRLLVSVEFVAPVVDALRDPTG